MINLRLWRVLVVFMGVVSIISLSACETMSLPEFDVFSQKPKQETAWKIPRKPLRETAGKKVSGKVKRYPHKKIRSEKLLDVEGHWNIVEKSKSYDPAKAHMQARKNVNVKRRGKNSELSAHFKPDAKSGHDGKLRVLRLEPQGGNRGRDNRPSDYEFAGSTVIKPEQKVAGNDSLKKISSFLGEDETVIRPPALPERRKKIVINNINNSEIITPQIKPLRGVMPKVDDKVNGSPVPQAKPKLNILGSKSTVNKMRSGINDGNTRIVIEVSHTTKYKVAIDELRNVFRVRLENTNWNIAPKGNLKGSDLLGSYVAKKQEDGSILLEMRLKKKAEILKTMVLKPNKTSNYRVVFDLKSL